MTTRYFTLSAGYSSRARDVFQVHARPVAVRFPPNAFGAWKVEGRRLIEGDNGRGRFRDEVIALIVDYQTTMEYRKGGILEVELE